MSHLPKQATDTAEATSLAEAYADAVVHFLRSGLHQTVTRVDGAYQAEVLDEGTSPTDVEIWIGEFWHVYVPGAPAGQESGSPFFRETIVARMTDAGTALQLLKRIRNQQREMI